MLDSKTVVSSAVDGQTIRLWDAATDVQKQSRQTYEAVPPLHFYTFFMLIRGSCSLPCFSRCASSRTTTVEIRLSVSLTTATISRQSHLNGNDSSRRVLRDKKCAPNHSSINGMSMGVHAAIITQFASTLITR